MEKLKRSEGKEKRENIGLVGRGEEEFREEIEGVNEKIN